MTIKDSALTMTITQAMDENNSYPYCLPYGVTVVTLDLDTGGETDVAGSQLAVTPPTDQNGNPYGAITSILLPDTQGYSFSPGSNTALVTETPFTWPETCQVTVKLKPTDTQNLSPGFKIDGIAEYIPSGGNVQTSCNYYLNVAQMTITEQMKCDGSYPDIKPGDTGTVTLELDTQGSLDASGAKLVIAAPAGTTITGVSLPSATSGTWTSSLSGDGSSATVTLTADGILWSSCQVTLQVDASTYGGKIDASVEYYNSGNESGSADANGQYSILVQAVNPDAISLKGLSLDLGDTIGGTRTVYKNGVMCAKFYVGFSYTAVSGEATTVQDIVNWLSNNASLLTCSSNQSYNGVPSDYDWTIRGNTDPNDGRYVFDTQVLVPANVEDQTKAPGNTVWHYAYFLTPDKANPQPINVYLSFNYINKGETKTKDTLYDTILTLEPDVWNNSELFHIYKNSTNGTGCVTYDPSKISDYNSHIHYVVGWHGEPDGLTVSPSADQYQVSNNLVAAYELPCNCASTDSTSVTNGRTFYVVACNYNSKNVVALIDNRDPAIPFTNSLDWIKVDGYQSQEILVGEFQIVDHIDCWSMSQKKITDDVMLGAVIGYWSGDANIEQFSNGNTNDHLDVFENSDANITARAVDSFGQVIDCKMTFGSGKHDMGDWSLQSVASVN